MVFIDASDKPKTLKVTSLQLILTLLSSFKISSFDKLLFKFFTSHTKFSLKKPCSIPKW